MANAAAASALPVQRSEEALPAREPVVLAVEGQGHRGRLPHNAFPLNRPEVAGVEAVVTIVTHHEVMPFWHANGTKLPQRWRCRNGRDSMGLAGEPFDGKDAAREVCYGQAMQPLLRDGLVFDCLTIEHQSVGEPEDYYHRA